MYSCNDCGAQFDEPIENCCPKCGSGDIFEEETGEVVSEETATMEQVVAEADEKNKKGFAVALREFGEQYIRYKNSLDIAKECIKDTIEMAKEKGITKDMLLAYASAVQLEDFNAKVLCSAVQQELGIEDVEEENNADTEQSDNQSDE
jgi:RNA polymerase subunit RPABC4/transcription elongation factor Spt4